MHRRIRPATVAALALMAVSCVATDSQRRASVLEFLYPEGSEAIPAQDVRLELPLRVGLAFAPAAGPMGSGGLDEAQKLGLLERVAEAFRGQEGIEGIEVIPSYHLAPGGGFENLGRLRGMYGIDLMALVSYEQVQFDETNKASLTYWTVVGAYVVPGNDTDTRTFVDTSVFDIRSRAMLFTASGQSRVQDSSTAIGVESDLRERSAEGFEEAFDGMIAQLGEGLEAFRDQARTGTVRGRGTPAIEVVRSPGSGGGVGAGSFGPAEGLAALMLLAVVSRGRRARGRSA